jgi:hypothetical protein
MKFVTLVLALALSPVACRKHTMTVSMGAAASNTLVAGTFIDGAGTYTHDDGSVTHELTVTPGPRAVTCQVTRREQRGMGSSSSSNGRTIPLAAPSDPWFIFVESPGRLWFFNGKDQLDYHVKAPGGGGSSGPAIASGQLRPNTPPIPPDLILRLPAELRKLLPTVEAPGTRPSF